MNKLINDLTVAFSFFSTKTGLGGKTGLKNEF